MGLFGKSDSTELFNKLSDTQKPPLTPQGGLLLATMTMIAVDCDTDEDEMSIIRRLDANSRKEDWDTAASIRDTHSVEECIELAAGSMGNEQRLVAIANLVDIAMADGTLAGEEQVLLGKYVDAFDVSKSEVKKIVHVISIKNNRKLF